MSSLNILLAVLLLLFLMNIIIVVFLHVLIHVVLHDEAGIGQVDLVESLFHYGELTVVAAAEGDQVTGLHEVRLSEVLEEHLVIF